MNTYSGRPLYDVIIVGGGPAGLNAALVLGRACKSVILFDDGRQNTSQPGVFVAGDADGNVQFIIVASAEGAIAALAVNRELQDEDRM